MSVPWVTDQAIRYDTSEGLGKSRRRGALYIAFVVIVAAVIGSAIVEAGTAVPWYGISTRTARASAEGVELEVRYPRVTRGGLDSAMHVNVRRRRGFDGPVTIEISLSYLALFLTNDVTPQPSSESNSGETLLMTFDPPRGDTFSADVDLSARPAGWFESRGGTVSFAAERGGSDVVVNIQTDVRP